MHQTKLAIIGSGPAGYTAGIYAARADLKPILIAGIKSGGQLMFTTVVENFPGFKDGKNGPDLMIEMRQQAEKFGTQIMDNWVSAVDFSQSPFKIWTSLPADFDTMQFEHLTKDGYQELRKKVMEGEPDVVAGSVIISTGAVSIMGGIPGEKELLGRGVATCAVCDAPFYKNKIAFVIGGGDSAMEDAMALAKFATQVTVVHRRDSFKASKIMQERVLNHPKIKVLWNSEVIEAIGENKLEKIKVRTTTADGQKIEEFITDGLFFAIGHKPMTQLFTDLISLDDHGYVITPQSPSKHGVELAKLGLDKNGLVTYPTMTSIPGVFAAGDVVDIRYKQAITSAGQGTAAALDAEKWLVTQE